MQECALKEGVPRVTVDGTLIRVIVDKKEDSRFYKCIFDIHRSSRLCLETHSREIAHKIGQSVKNGNRQFRVTVQIKSLKVQKGSWAGRWISKLEIKDIEPITWGRVESFDDYLEREFGIGEDVEQSQMAASTENPSNDIFEIDTKEPPKNVSPTEENHLDSVQKPLSYDSHRKLYGVETTQDRAQRLLSLGDSFEKITRDMGHKYLNDGDSCYYLGHYAPGKGPEYSGTNRLVLGMKHGDAQAITAVGQTFRRALMKFKKTQMVFVPVPPSSQNESTRKDRMEQMLDEANKADLIVIKYVWQTMSTDPNHQPGTTRMTPEDLEDIYEVENKKHGAVKTIAIVDDVLTTGAHFRAMSNVLKRSIWNVSIMGLFIARTMRPDEFDNTGIDKKEGSSGSGLEDLEEDLPF